MLGPATTSTKTLKLIVPKNYTSQATLSILSCIVFSILPKNTKKKKKVTKKCITYTLSLLQTITISGKVFSILPNNKEKNTRKPKNIKKNRNTQNKKKNSPKTKTNTQEYKSTNITQNLLQYKTKTEIGKKTLFKPTTKTKNTHHYLKRKPNTKKQILLS
jgi:hypothetical protein